MKLLRLALVVMIAAACQSPASPTATTGLTGFVLRGPITPVCRINEPCDAPFSANFTIEQNGQLVTQFQSDHTGHFTVMLAPGTYRVVPAANAPVMFPRSQARTVEVMASGLTEVRLVFDTGIR